MEAILGILALVLRVAPALGSGYLAYQWVNPHSFLGFVGFLVIWGLFGYVADLLIGLVLGAIGLIANGGK